MKKSELATIPFTQYVSAPASVANSTSSTSPPADTFSPAHWQQFIQQLGEERSKYLKRVFIGKNSRCTVIECRAAHKVRVKEMLNGSSPKFMASSPFNVRKAQWVHNYPKVSFSTPSGVFERYTTEGPR